MCIRDRAYGGYSVYIWWMSEGIHSLLIRHYVTQIEQNQPTKFGAERSKVPQQRSDFRGPLRGRHGSAKTHAWLSHCSAWVPYWRHFQRAHVELFQAKVYWVEQEKGKLRGARQWKGTAMQQWNEDCFIRVLFHLWLTTVKFLIVSHFPSLWALSL